MSLPSGPHRSLSTLSLREVTREAGIAPNSFYRQFRDMDELAVALIDLAGRSLRKIIGQARQRASTERSVVQGSLETFMEQLRADDKLLHVLLREGTVGSDAFKQAVDRELNFFEDELCIDLVRLAAADGARLYTQHCAACHGAPTRTNSGGRLQRQSTNDSGEIDLHSSLHRRKLAQRRQWPVGPGPAQQQLFCE